MSATGFQRRRRELALREKSQEPAGDGVTAAKPKNTNKPKPAAKPKKGAGATAAEPAELTLPLAAEKRKEIEGKVVEAGIKTAEETAALADEDLVALFDAIGK